MSDPPITRARDAWNRFWYGSADAIRLDALRQGMAFTLLIYVVTWSRNAEEWLTHVGFHPTAAVDAANAPQVPLLTPELLPWAGILFFGSLAAFIFGIKRSVTTWIVLGCILYITYADRISSFTINRLYIITFFIFAIAPRPKTTDTKEKDSPRLQVAWPLRMVQVLLVSHYFASALCKMFQGHWLEADDVLWTQVQGFYMTDLSAWLVRTLPDWAWAGMQHQALAFELLAPLLFGIRRLRPLAFVWGIAFHVVIALTMYKLIFFSAQMIALYLVFVPPEWFHRLSRRLR